MKASAKKPAGKPAGKLSATRGARSGSKAKEPASVPASNGGTDMAKKTEEVVEFTPAPELEAAVEPEPEPAKKGKKTEPEPDPLTGTLDTASMTVTLADGSTRTVEPDEFDDLGDGKVRLRR